MLKNTKAIILYDHKADLTPVVVCGIKWDGWGIKGEGATVEDAIASAAQELAAYLAIEKV